MLKENTQELYLHEWAAIAIVLGFILMSAGSAYLSSPPLHIQTGPPHYLVDPTVEVFVQGSVAHPGPRRVPRGTTVEEVLEMAGPLPEANLGRFNLKAKVRDNQVFKVQAKKPPRVRKKALVAAPAN